jgi:hypothetical protein
MVETPKLRALAAFELASAPRGDPEGGRLRRVGEWVNSRKVILL